MLSWPIIIKGGVMAEAVIFVLHHRTGWKMVVGEQRIGAYETAEAACWAAMSLAVHLREEGAAVELRLHDEGGIRRLWPPEFAVETTLQRAAPSEARRFRAS